MKKLILALICLLSAIPCWANPIPVPPPASMPLEDMHIVIQPCGDGLHATFTGDFTFDYIPMDVFLMLFPVPPDANNIRVWQDDVELPWSWSSDTYPTILPELPTIPMIEWLGPFPTTGAVFRVDYEHDLIKRPEEFIFFYASGTGKYFGTYDKTTTAYFDILLPVGYKAAGVWLDDMPHAYQVDGYHLTLTVQSGFGPIINDLIVSLVSDPAGDDCNGNGIPDGEDLAPPVDFSNRADYTVGDRPSAVACADLNGDSTPDLAVTNGSSDNVSVLMNNGSGAFGSSTNYAVGEYPKSVAASDLNGDGDVDLAVANQNSDNVSLLFNNGDGTFAPKCDYVAGDGACSIKAADFDGDGDNDLVVANTWDRSISVLLNNGSGTFAPQVKYTVGKYPQSIACGDFNNDQKPDLAVGAVYSLAILLNNGNGTFAPAIYYDVGYWPKFVTCGDFDTDDDLDLAVVDTSSNTVAILYNDGAGTFTTGPSYGVRPEPGCIITADLDDNGSLDLAVACADYYDPIGIRTAGTISILLNCGDGTFRAGRDVGMLGVWREKIAAAELNNDSLPDLAVANGYETNEVTVLLNQTPPPSSHDWNSNGVPDECENTKPIAEAGPNQVAYAWIDGYADVNLDGSGSYDDDNDPLDYYWLWTIDGNTFTSQGPDGIVNMLDFAAFAKQWSQYENPFAALSILTKAWLSTPASPNWNRQCDIAPAGAVITIELPVGEHTIELVVDDGIEESEPDYCTIEVIAPLQARLFCIPRSLNRKTSYPIRLLALISMPPGVRKADIDLTEPLIFYPGQVESQHQFAFEFGRRWHRRTYVWAWFDKSECIEQLEPGFNRVNVVGKLTSGRYYDAAGYLRLVPPKWHHWPHFYHGRR